MKRLLSVILCLGMLFTCAPLAALAANDPIKIVSVTANTNQNYDSDEITVEFTGPTDSDAADRFAAELCYTYQANGHPYTVRRRGGNARVNDEGSYTLKIEAPYSLLDDAFLKPTLAIVTIDKNGAETLSKPIPLTAAPEKSHYCSPLKVTVGDKVYTYGPGLDEEGKVKTTFPKQEENGVFFDPDTRTLTLSGASGAKVEADSLTVGRDLNKIVLNGAVFDSIRFYDHKPIEIELIGANAGNLIAQNDSDIFLKGADGASLTGYIDASSAACILSNLAWTEAATGQRNYTDLHAITANAVAFDRCTANLSSESVKEPVVCVVGWNDLYINDNGMILRDCPDFRVTHKLKGICCEARDFLIDNSELTITGVHESDTSSDHPDFVGIDEKRNSVDITLQNHAKLNVDMTQNGKSNSVNAVRCEILTVDGSSEINAKVLASETGEGSISGMFPQQLHLSGKVQVDVTNRSGGGVTGLSMGKAELDGGKLTVNVDGKATIYGVSPATIKMNKASLTVNAVGRVESENKERVYLFNAGIDQTIIDSTVDLSFLLNGTGGYDFFECMDFFGTTEIRGSTLRVGIHSAPSKFSARRFSLVSDYVEATESSVPKIIARVPADYLSLAQGQVNAFVKKAFDSSVDISACICTGNKIDANCMKSAISEPVRSLTVILPKVIADKAAQLNKSRLVVTKNGEQKTIWEGRSLAEGVTAYAFSEETYSDAQLQSLISGAYRTVAYYDGAFSNSGEITLKSSFDKDFCYVEGIRISDTDGGLVSGEAYRATVTDDKGKVWTVPGFLTAGKYTVTLEGKSYSKLYDYAAFNKSKNNSFTAADGVVSLKGLRLIVPSVTVSGTVKDADGKPLPGVFVRADQTYKNGCGFSVTAQTDTAGKYRFTLFGAEAVNGKNSFTAQYASYLLLDAGGKVIEGNRFETEPQKNGATLDLTLKKMPSSVVSLSYSLDREAVKDEATQKYLTKLSKGFILSGEIDGKQLKNTYKGSADLSSGQYSLWNGADADCLINGGRTLKLSVSSGAYSIADKEKTVKLDADNCAAATLTLSPRAGIVAAIRAPKRQGIGSYGAAWYNAKGEYVGTSSERKMIGDEIQTVSFVSPVNESGSYTVVFSPFNAPEKLADVDASLTRISVKLVKNRGVDVGSVTVDTAAIENIAFITKPNSTISAPESWSSQNEIVRMPGHIETDGDIAGARLSSLSFKDYHTTSKFYCTLDADGDGEAERYDVTLWNGIGSLSFNNPPALPLDFTLYVLPNAEGSVQLDVAATIKLADGKTQSEQSVGSVTVGAPGAYLAAPERTVSETVPVSGTAPARERVLILDGDTVVAEVKANVNGRFSATVTLVGCEEGRASLHKLRSSSSAGDSEPATVIYNANGAALLRSGFTYSDRPSSDRSRYQKYISSDGAYTFTPAQERNGIYVTLSAEFANPDEIRTDYSDLNVGKLMSSPVVFAIQLMNGEVQYYQGKRSGKTGTFLSEEFKIYSAINRISVLYDTKQDVFAPSVDGIPTRTVGLSSVLSAAAKQSVPTGKQSAQLRDKLSEVGLNVSAGLTDAQNAMSAPELMNSLRKDLGAIPKNKFGSIGTDRAVTEAQFKKDLDYAKARVKANADDASLEAVDVVDGNKTPYRYLSFSETDPDNGTVFMMTLIEDLSGKDPAYHETALLLTDAEQPLSVPASGGKKAANGGKRAPDTRAAVRKAAAPSKATVVSGCLDASGFIPSWLESSAKALGYVNAEKFFFGFGKGISIAGMGLSVYAHNQTNNECEERFQKALRTVFTPCYNSLPEKWQEIIKSKLNAFSKLNVEAWSMNNDTLAASLFTGAINLLGGNPVSEGIAAVGNFCGNWINDDYQSNIQKELEMMQDDIRRIYYNNGLEVTENEDCKKVPDRNMKAPRVGLDPSGYVYEAVASNRVEGAEVTLYQNVKGVKTKVADGSEDIFGAANPLISDADGRYEWFVPEGLWLVEVKADGYVPADSQSCTNIKEVEKRDGYTWLQVLPPQTAVNIGVVCKDAPYIKNIFAKSDGVEIEFSRYMDESTLVPANFTLKNASSPVSFTVRKLNSEKSPVKPGVSYTSRILLKTAELPMNTALTVGVSGSVKSYAGVAAGDSYNGVVKTVQVYKLTVKGGTAEKNVYAYPAGASVTITANAPTAGFAFSGWKTTGVALPDALHPTVTFTMPAGDVTVTAGYAGHARGAQDKQKEYTPGDVDGDGKISSADARLALRRSVSLENYPEGSVQFLACDVDGDNKVSSADARLILRASVGLEDATKWKKQK
ncbi:MAG: hypothetical protein IJK89_12230 [Clostridia bacterium]|nr:hypothetical protein [Clostridia bacterium]